jgi:hypothetical protein
MYNLKCPTHLFYRRIYASKIKARKTNSHGTCRLTPMPNIHACVKKIKQSLFPKLFNSYLQQVLHHHQQKKISQKHQKRHHSQRPANLQQLNDNSSRKNKEMPKRIRKNEYVNKKKLTASTHHTFVQRKLLNSCLT